MCNFYLSFVHRNWFFSQHVYCTFLGFAMQIHEESKVTIVFWGVAMFGLAIFAAVVVAYQRRKHSEEGYQSIAS